MSAKPDTVAFGALLLDGTPESVKRYYDQWSDDYETDVIDGYQAPLQTMAQLELALTGDIWSAETDVAALRVTDVGCGTGLVGELLSRRGFIDIDGFDLSPEMVAKAELLGIYQQLQGDFDLNQPLPVALSGQYDIALCCGVFTSGHVPPNGIFQLLDFVRQGGLAICSTRESYYEESHYEAVNQQLAAKGYARLVHSKMHAPYTRDESAHYWVYERS